MHGPKNKEEEGKKNPVSCIPNGLVYWVNFIVHTYFTNVTAGRCVSLVRLQQQSVKTFGLHFPFSVSEIS